MGGGGEAGTEFVGKKSGGGSWDRMCRELSAVTSHQSVTSKDGAEQELLSPVNLRPQGTDQKSTKKGSFKPLQP